jgi:ribonucleoside-diphosphate reductase alpha chain
MDEWPEHLVFIGQVMSDCNITQYIRALDNASEQDRNVLKRIKLFTEKFRALGSGVMGLGSWFQKKRIVWGSLDSFYENAKIFKHLNKQSLEASKWLAEVLGEPEGCKGFGIRNATRLSMPPTKSTAELCYGVSEGINPDAALVFTKMSSGGEVFRIVPELLLLMKERGVYNEDTLTSINQHKGSVQHVEWLDDHEKKVFRTAFEIDQYAIVRLASQRQPEIDQGQSLNLYFAGNASPKYILDVHKEAMLDDQVLSLYYNYSTRGGDFKQPEPCEVCT